MVEARINTYNNNGSSLEALLSIRIEARASQLIIIEARALRVEPH